ncbi:MAG: hypothetical protein A2487_16680 [Candidatus Raymondbacteria bacterium RifOxyC12_full_50_8]|nr:MAG: hypothetical protein A2487_16680 [Candidatus Raymondbacteria bacterium RifOxyC12_full_50_8]
MPLGNLSSSNGIGRTKSGRACNRGAVLLFFLGLNLNLGLDLSSASSSVLLFFLGLNLNLGLDLSSASSSVLPFLDLLP